MIFNWFPAKKLQEPTLSTTYTTLVLKPMESEQAIDEKLTALHEKIWELEDQIKEMGEKIKGFERLFENGREGQDGG